ncbi:MAG: magnesium/cobalt transporter CorA, partial [Candidatus Methanoperedens sp.]
MEKLIKKRSTKTGLPPGELIHIGEKKTEKAIITILDYDEEHFEEKEAKNIEECFPFKDKPTITWINIDGLHQVDIIEKIGKEFGFHPLLLEDILNTEQRPKIEDFEDSIYFVLKMLYYEEKTNEINTDQVSVIFGNNFVISFQEREGDIFNPIRERIRTGKSRIRKMGADYLAYSLMDAVVDSYFIILEKFGEKIEDIEETMIASPTPETLRDIHNLKSRMISLRKSVWPLREVISVLERSESSLIQESTRMYLKDVYDHTIQIIETVETFRDILSSMLDVYLSSISYRMNEIMKVLTIIATIFIP